MAHWDYLWVCLLLLELSVPIQKGKGAVGWAWAINGLFAVLGGVCSIVLAIYAGFFNTLMIAFAIYIIAGILLP